MADKLYSIKETTLTDIGDALRRKHGETRTETVTVEEIIPNMVVSKTPNATGFYESIGNYADNLTQYDVVRVPNASYIRVRVRYEVENFSDKLYICKGNQSGGVSSYEYVLTSTSVTDIQEYDIEGDTITFYFISDSNTNYFGYYAECTGLDENKNILGEQTREVEKEVEIPNKYASDEMAQAIDDIESGNPIPDSALIIKGDCIYMFNGGKWDWFLTQYGNKITTQDILSPEYMFQGTQVESIPFDMNFLESSLNDSYGYKSFICMFYGATKLKEIGDLVNAYPQHTRNMFTNCYMLRELPNFVNAKWDRLQSYQYNYLQSMFGGCYSLRQIPDYLIKEIYNPTGTSTSYFVGNNICNSCYALDEIKGLNPQTGTMTSNAFQNSFNNCHRLKDITFAVQEDGSPYALRWHSQTIDLATYPVGYAKGSNDNVSRSYILDYNSGITADKEVYDDATYQALKNDADWFTIDVAYCRYNHDSAVNTINTLPDTSEYLATLSGKTNTIKFKGESGSKTDGGAINTLTAEEIAIATAKGWTVTLT